VLVFERTALGFSVVGGTGRGASWAGIVEVSAGDDGLVGRAWQRGTPERISGSTATQIAGPYYVPHAAAVPVGQKHVVVFGSQGPLIQRDADLIRSAATVVDGTHGVSAAKLLADELEVVHALRALMAYRPLTVRDTVRHVAAVAAGALSCEVAVIRVEVDGEVMVEGLDLRSSSTLDRPDATGHLGAMARTTTIEQVAAPDPDLFGVDVASTMTLPLAGEAAGMLALGHTATRARGFTSLCQRIGRAIAETAELLISQARTREELASERDLLARLAKTDALTGGANRRAWDAEVERWSTDPPDGEAYVLACDLDGLKDVNDRFGHVTGDFLIRAAHNLLRASTRETDLVARVGGDEFVVLLAPADAAAARGVVRRLRRAGRVWRVTEHALSPQLSVGLVPVIGGDLEGARAAADRSMYANKRRRARAARTRPIRDRRTA
jgi:diguanylate cyclase (GGDEF)-like protein